LVIKEIKTKFFIASLYILDDQSELRVAFGKFSVEIGDLNDPKKNIQISPF
jgi:hypothetical protein